jgi:hypothetical protein
MSSVDAVEAVGDEDERDARVAFAEEAMRIMRQEHILPPEPSELQVRTNRVATGALSEVEYPKMRDPFDHSVLRGQQNAKLLAHTYKKASEVVQNLPRPGERGLEAEDVPDLSLEEVVQSACQTTGAFPNLAYEIIRLGLEMENFQTENRLNRYQEQGHEYKGTIGTLLDLTAQLQKLPSDADSHELSDKVKQMLSDLKDKRIDLLPDHEGQISREQLVSVKSLINSHVDALRSKLTDLFTTKISIVVQFLNTMTETMKNIVRLDDRVKSTAIQLARQR